MKYTTIIRIGIVYFFVILGTYFALELGDMPKFLWAGVISFGIATLLATPWIKKCISFICKNKALCISMFLFAVAGIFWCHFVLIVMGNDYAIRHPDGYPIVIPWGSIGHAIVFTLLGVAIDCKSIFLLETKEFLTKDSIAYL